MTTKELFESVIAKRNWQKNTGLTPQEAQVYKWRFRRGKLGDVAISNILIKLGYKKTVTWSKKEKNKENRAI